jgi:hypothetical protein
MDSACGKIIEDGLTISDQIWKKFRNQPSGNIPGKNRELSEPPQIQIEGINFDLDC